VCEYELCSEYSLIVCQLVQILNAAFEFILLNLFALLTKDQRDKRSERGSEFFSFCCNIKQLKDFRVKLIATVGEAGWRLQCLLSDSHVLQPPRFIPPASSSAALQVLAACQRFVCP